MTPSAEAFRELFMLDPDVTYLNHGSFGAVPRPVFEFQHELRRELEREPVLFLARRLPARLARVRGADRALRRGGVGQRPGPGARRHHRARRGVAPAAFSSGAGTRFC